MVTPDSLPHVSPGIAFYIDRKDQRLLVAFDVFMCCPRCKIDAEAHHVVLLCDGTRTVTEIAEKVHQKEPDVCSLLEILLERNVVCVERVV